MLYRSILTSFVVALCAMACSVVPKKEPLLPPEPPRVCQVSPPPQWEPVAAVMGGEANCPPEFAACLTTEGAVVLMRNVRAMGAWASEAVARCGSAPGVVAPSPSGASGSSGASPANARKDYSTRLRGER